MTPVYNAGSWDKEDGGQDQPSKEESMETEEMYRSFQEIQLDLRLDFATFKIFIKQNDLSATRSRLEWLVYCQGWWDGQRAKVWWNQNDEAYHPEWGRVIVMDSNRDVFGHMRCRQMDTEAQCIVPASPEHLTAEPPECKGCHEGHLERRASDRLFACPKCGLTASQVREKEAQPA